LCTVNMDFIQWNNFYGTVIYPLIPNFTIKKSWIKCESRIFYTDLTEDLNDKDIRPAYE
ncbi:hypothetical protein ACJMK2_032129, partial [Sinanodonta woodiana]